MKIDLTEEELTAIRNLLEKEYDIKGDWSDLKDDLDENYFKSLRSALKKLGVKVR